MLKSAGAVLFLIASFFLVATASVPLASCCAATCGFSSIELVIHGFDATAPATVTVKVDGTPTVFDAQPGSSNTDCHTDREISWCDYENGDLSVSAWLGDSYARTESQVDVLIVQGASSSRFDVPVAMTRHEVCGVVCYTPTTKPEIWLGRAG
jgi:hypothetical protein